MRKALSTAVLVMTFAALGTRPAWACACTSVSPFPAKSASILIIGKVVAVAPADKQTAFQGANTRRFFDVDVIRVVGSHQLPNRVRIWDPWYATSCEGGVRQLPGDALIVVSVQTRKDMPSGVREIWMVSGILPRERDLFIGPACSEVLKVLIDPPGH